MVTILDKQFSPSGYSLSIIGAIYNMVSILSNIVKYPKP